MKNQIFKSLIPMELLWDFFKKNSEEHDECFFFTKEIYKKAIFHETIAPFISQIEPYYHDSKKHYITRKMDYMKFITIIRQICNVNDITYTKQMSYDKSSYEIVYYIYKPTDIKI